MPGITTGVGLASGINTGQIIEQLLAIDAQAKTPLQKQITSIQAAKTAMFDVNARLLGIRSASTKFRVGRVFEQMKVTTGDDSFLAATAKPGTPPGKYTFNVSRLVSTSQMLTRGFSSGDMTPLGLSSLTFEYGDAAVSRPTMLSSLRAGEGVGQGSIKITDAAGQSATIDLGGSVTLQDIVGKINDSETIGVDASIENERVVLRDSSGGAAALVVTNVGSGTIGTRLGIVGSFASGTVTGGALNTLGMNSSLSELNDGNGVLIRDGNTDFKIVDGTTTYDISLGRKNQPISTTSKLTDLNNGIGVRINTTDADDLTIVTSTGVSVGINLGAVLVNGEVQTGAVTTVGELITRVNSKLSTTLGSSGVQLSLRADGTGFNLTDTLGGSNPAKVLGAGPNGEKTARDLGIYTGSITTGPSTIVGTAVPNKVSIPRAATVQDLADRVLEQTSGKVRVEINTAGTGLRLVSNTGSNVSVLAGIIDGSSFGAQIGERTARDLGLFGLSSAGSVEGSRLSAGISTVRTANLIGGSGLSGADDISITDRSGHTLSLSGLSSHDTLASLVGAINTAATTAGVQVKLSVADSGRSVIATDSSGGSGDFVMDGMVARRLGLATSVSTSAIRGSDLDRKYIGFSTSLASLNFGKGVGSGSFTITDSAGGSGTVNIDSSDSTVYDVIKEINARGLLVEARINSTGDGITIVDTNTGAPATGIEVKDTSGTVARALGIAKKASTAGASIDGSFEKTVSLATTDTLNDVVAKIKAAGVGVNAAVINTGSGAAPYRLSLTSQYGGSRGQLLVDSGAIDLGLVRSSEGRDAALILGGTSPSETPSVFTSSTNDFKDILSGLEVTAKKIGQTTVEVGQDTDGMLDAVKAWAKSINDTITKLADYDKYDSTTKAKGALFGNSTVAVVRQQLISTVQAKPRGITGQYQYLTQIGIKVGAKSQVTVDEDALRNALESDSSSVQELFAGFQVQSTGSTSPIAGVTVESTTTTYGKLGIGDTFDQLAQRLTNTVDGSTVVADRNFQKQIDGLKSRMETIDTRLAAKRTRYERQFAAMERAISKIQSQQSSVASIPTSFG
jgi:flagellar hook-associated protein 2